MTPQEALQLGLSIGRVGIPFRGMDILAAAGQGAEPSGALAARIATQTNAFRARNAETIQGVFQVEAILGKNGLERPERPQTLEGFARWAGSASKAASAAVPLELARRQRRCSSVAFWATSWRRWPSASWRCRCSTWRATTPS